MMSFIDADAGEEEFVEAGLRSELQVRPFDVAGEDAEISSAFRLGKMTALEVPHRPRDASTGA